MGNLIPHRKEKSLRVGSRANIISDFSRRRTGRRDSYYDERDDYDYSSSRYRHRSRERDDDRYTSRRDRERRENDYYDGGRRDRVDRRSRSPRRRGGNRRTRYLSKIAYISHSLLMSVCRSRSPQLTEDERDRRTVFVQQLAARLRTKELITFFEKVGPVKEAQIVKDRVSGRSKGYVVP